MKGNGLPDVMIGRTGLDLGKFTPEDGELGKEQGWHRQAAYLLITGTTVKKVAEFFRKTPATITNLLKNKWFQRMMTELADTEGTVDVLAWVKAEAFASVGTLIELRDCPDVSPTVRSNIAMNFIDRAYGKPVQKVETTAEIRSTDPVKEEAKLLQEIQYQRNSLGLSSAPEGQDLPDTSPSGQDLLGPSAGNPAAGSTD